MFAVDLADLLDNDTVPGVQTAFFGRTPSAAVWTGTDVDGTLYNANNTCFDWDSHTGVGLAGVRGGSANSWTRNSINSSCSNPKPLYCFRTAMP